MELERKIFELEEQALALKATSVKAVIHADLQEMKNVCNHLKLHLFTPFEDTTSECYWFNYKSEKNLEVVVEVVSKNRYRKEVKIIEY